MKRFMWLWITIVMWPGLLRAGGFEKPSFNEDCDFDLQGCIENSLYTSPTLRDLREPYLKLLNDRKLSFDEAHAMSWLVPNGLVVHVDHVDQYNDYVVGALAWGFQVVINEAAGQVITRIPSKLGQSVAKKALNLFDRILPKASVVWNDVAYATVKRQSRAAFASAVTLFSSDEFVKRTPELRAYIFNSMLENMENQWSKYSAAEKDAYFLSMFIMVEKRFELIEGDIAVLGKWQSESTADDRQAVSDKELAHYQKTIKAHYESGLEGGEFSDLAVDIAAVTDHITEPLRQADQKREVIDKQTLSLEAKLAAYQEIYQEVDAKVSFVRTEVAGIAAFIRLFDPELSAKINTSMESVSLLSQGVTAILNGPTAGAVLGGVGTVGAGLQLLQTFTSGQGVNTDLVILESLAAISSQIQNLHRFVEANFQRTQLSFNQVQSKLNAIHSTMLSEFTLVKTSILELQRSLDRIKQQIEAQTNLYSQFSRDQLVLDYNVKMRTLRNDFIARKKSVDQSTLLEFLNDYRKAVVGAYNSVAWAGSPFGFTDGSQILESDFVAEELLSSGKVESPLDYFVESGRGYYGVDSLSPFEISNPSQWMAANQMLSFIVLQARLIDLPGINDRSRDDSLYGQIKNVMEQGLLHGQSYLGFAFDLQRDPRFFEGLLKNYQQAYMGLVYDLAFQMATKLNTRVEEGGMLSVEAYRTFLDSLIARRFQADSKYFPQDHGTLALATAQNLIINQPLESDWGVGIKLSLPSQDHDLSATPLLNGKSLPALLWPAYDLDLGVSEQAVDPLPASVLIAAKFGLLSYYQDYRVSSRGSELVLTHRGILNDPATGEDHIVAEIDVEYHCQDRLAVYGNLPLLQAASDRKVVFQYHSDGAILSCAASKRVTRHDVKLSPSLEKLIHERLAKRLEPQLAQLLQTSQSRDLFRKHARLLHYFSIWAFPESFRRGDDLILPMLDGSVHPIGDLQLEFERQFLAAMSSLSLESYRFAAPAEGELTKYHQATLDLIEGSESLGFDSGHPVWTGLIAKLTVNQQATEHIYLKSKRIEDIYPYFNRLLDYGLEADPRILPQVFFQWSFLDYQSVYGSKEPPICEGGLAAGDESFRDIPAGKLLERCLADGRLSTVRLSCEPGYVPNGSLSDPRCSPSICGDYKYLDRWNETIAGGAKTFQCGPLGEVVYLSTTCRTDQYRYSSDRTQCEPKPCGSYGHGQSWSQAIPYGSLHYSCSFGNVSSYGRCQAGHLYLGGNCNTKRSCSNGTRYGDVWYHKQTEKCVEKTFRNYCNSGGVIESHLDSQRSISCGGGGGRPKPPGHGGGK